MVGSFSFKNRRLRLLAIIGVATLILTLVSYAAYACFLPKKPAEAQSSTIDTPALVGRSLIKAQETAEEQGLKIEIDEWVSSKVYPTNYIVTQKPLPGQPIEKGSKIIIKVSGGKSYPGPKKERDSVELNDDAKPLPTPPIQPKQNLEDKTVAIDAGHQRKANLEREPVGPGAKATKAKVQGGTSGIDSKTPEYEVTLAIAVKLKTALEAYGVKVIMTRETHDIDISNSQRADVANRNNADLFVRIHADGALDTNMYGISTLYPAQNSWTAGFYAQSMKAARLVQRNLVTTALGKDNGIVARDDISGFNWSKVPVILVETGFMTNPKEDRLLNDPRYQEKLANGIASGVVEYLKAAE